MHKMMPLLLAGSLALLTACEPPAERRAPSEPSEEPSGEEMPATDDAASAAEFETDLLTQFIEAEPGDVINIPEGNHSLSRSLTLNTDGVTVRGAGMDRTILSFADQIAGAEGILVNASNFTIEDLAIEDARGDALKINQGDNLVIRRVRTEWTGGPHVENGSYGIYPVQADNVLIEDSVAIAASDAGIYVGQSSNIIVRRNRVEWNVAGIEIENSVHADVYENEVTANTGGILVFNMPDLPMPGHSTRVFDNRIVENNTANFAPAGTAVAGVPAGTGILINSNDRVEVFNNEIADNRTANVLISSFYSTMLQSREQAEQFDPFPETIYIYDNEFSGGGNRAGRPELDQLRVAAYGEDGSLPDVLWDGIVNPAYGQRGLPEEKNICIDNEDADFINADAMNDFQNFSTDIEPHLCQHEKLPAVSLDEA